ncbi:MAG TPA: imidazoleglycerol-phosphate dehydratase HisB [Candidatus Omnitrophota bacterium]|nr:imidazoleglycerol-phosphate dehydratase HisB [Candidatus Omnitrophota bacterium]
MKKRKACLQRKTKETRISVTLGLDGTGRYRVSTGIGFLDHMLELFAKHGKFDLEIAAKGDLHVDRHHTNEDTGLALGKAFAAALKEKTGITRYGFFCAPMGEALVRVALDLSGRPSFYFRSGLKLNQRSEPYKIEDAEHFLESLAQAAGINLHIDILAGRQLHHVLEAAFKALARALDQATRIDPREKGVPSTKGVL